MLTCGHAEACWINVRIDEMVPMTAPTLPNTIMKTSSEYCHLGALTTAVSVCLGSEGREWPAAAIQENGASQHASADA